MYLLPFPPWHYNMCVRSSVSSDGMKGEILAEFETYVVKLNVVKIA